MKSRENKGITLIALIVTIIIILILVGITINLLLGDNGLIQNAKKSKFMTCFRTVEEKVELYKADKRMPTVSGYEETPNKTEILPVGEKLDLTQKSKITTLVTEVEKISGKSIEQVNLYWIDKEKISVKYKHQYVIDIDTEQIYDYEGETFFGNHHHTMEETTVVTEEAFIEDPTPNDISDNKIYTIEDLMRFSYKTNNKDGNISTFQGETITLMNNLDFQSEKSYKNPQTIEFGDVNEDGVTEGLIEELNKGKGFLPISMLAPFLGTFDGNNKSLTNLNTIGRSNSGLFSMVSTNGTIATIKNLKLKNINLEGSGYTAGIASICGSPTIIENCSVEGGNIRGGAVAGIVGIYTIESISNCHNTANLEGSSVGGIIYMTTNSSNSGLINLYNKGNIKSSGNSGGIVCSTANTIPLIKGCYNTGDIEATDNAAGIKPDSVSFLQMDDCYNTGKITGKNAAGIAIYADNLEKISNCYNSGEINKTSTSTTDYGAGLLGRATSNTTKEVINCRNTANINGGEAGLIAETSIIKLKDCYNTGDINDGIAGLVAKASRITQLENCYNTGNITKNELRSYCAGLIGTSAYIDNGIINCYNTGNITNGSGLIDNIENLTGNVTESYNSGTIVINVNRGAVGGIVGNVSIKTTSGEFIINNSYNKGEINVKSENSSIGGIIGYGTVSSNDVILKLTNCYNELNVNAIKGCAGGLIGECFGKNLIINDCYNKGSIISEEKTAGGLIGSAYSINVKDMNNCINNGNVKGGEKVGGMFGQISIIENANEIRNTGSIEGTNSTSIVGGLVGEGVSVTKITNASNIGDVVGAGEKTAGIIANVNAINSMENIYNTGTITGNTKTAGILCNVSSGSVTLQNVYNTGNIDGTTAAGIIYKCSGTATLTNAYNTGNIKTTSSTNYTAGLVADTSGANITNAYTTGAISYEGNTTGSIVGKTVGGKIENTYYTQDLPSICSKNETYITDNSTKKSILDMQKDEFVTTLGPSVWTRSNYKNDGLPYFK